MEYGTCSRCHNDKGIKTEVYNKENGERIAFRCDVRFCENCLPKAMKNNPNFIYIPSILNKENVKAILNNLNYESGLIPIKIHEKDD